MAATFVFLGLFFPCPGNRRQCRGFGHRFTDFNPKRFEAYIGTANTPGLEVNNLRILANEGDTSNTELANR